MSSEKSIGMLCSSLFERPQKAKCVTIAHELWQHYEEEGNPFSHRIIAIDETWVRDYEPELKSQSTAWKGKEKLHPWNFEERLQKWNL